MRLGATVSISEPLASLATRIRDEIVDLDAVLWRALVTWPHAQQPPHAAVDLDADLLAFPEFLKDLSQTRGGRADTSRSLAVWSCNSTCLT